MGRRGQGGEDQHPVANNAPAPCLFPATEPSPEFRRSRPDELLSHSAVAADQKRFRHAANNSAALLLFRTARWLRLIWRVVPRARLVASAGRARSSDLGRLMWYLSASNSLALIQNCIRDYDHFSDDGRCSRGAMSGKGQKRTSLPLAAPGSRAYVQPPGGSVKSQSSVALAL